MTNIISNTDPSPSRKNKTVDPAEDGRNIEWEDRARVNLEEVPENVQTNIERDFEPEQLEKKKGKDEEPPAY